jgi:hypothetical protein
MLRLLEALTEAFRKESLRSGRRRRDPRRRDPPFVGGSRIKDIEQAPPGRAEELVGHAVERVDT